MSTETQAQKIIERAIDCLNELVPVDQAVDKDARTVLLGVDGKLDSMSFVNFVVAVDQELELHLGVKVSLVDELGSKWEGDLTVQDANNLVARLIDRVKPTR